MYGAEWCLEGAARGVFERLARLERRLLPDDAQAPDLFEVVIGVRDDPVPVG